MKTSEINKVFVYGTLRRDARNPCENYGGKYLGRSKLQCCTMFDLGAFPGIKLEGDGSVVGDIYEVDESIIKSLDRYEGCRPDSPHNSLYNRKIVTVPNYGQVYVYEYNGYPHNRRKVEGGDWLNYEKKEERM